MLDRRLNVPVIGLIVLALDGEHRDPVVLDQRCRHVVLGAERVRGAEPDFRAAGLEGLGEVRGLGGHMEAGADPHALEGLLLGEPLLDQPQDRHAGFGPLDLELALGSQLDVFHVVIQVTSLANS